MTGVIGDVFADPIVVRAGEKFPEPAPTLTPIETGDETSEASKDVSVAAGGVTGTSTVP